MCDSLLVYDNLKTKFGAKIVLSLYMYYQNCKWLYIGKGEVTLKVMSYKAARFISS